MANLKGKVIAGKVLVRPSVAEEKTAGGIYIPDSAKDAPLFGEVVLVGNALKDQNVEIKEGDKVTIYLTMIPELAYTMLACARIGAVHSIIFGGFSPDSIATRINDCESEYLITADEGVRGGKIIPLKKIADELGDNRLFQFGIRSGTKKEFQYAKNHQYIEIAGVKTLPDIISKLQGHPIYITLDVDVLDPSIMSGTGTPEAGGITYKELLEALLVLKDQNIVGADVVELAPDYDNSGVSTATACTLIRELLLLMAK